LKKEEIYNDILELQKELYNKKMVIITHIANDDNKDRSELILWLEDICSNLNISIINPVKEIEKMGYIMSDLKSDDTHYNEMGHNIIKTIYEKYIIES